MICLLVNYFTNWFQLFYQLVTTILPTGFDRFTNWCYIFTYLSTILPTVLIDLRYLAALIGLFEMIYQATSIDLPTSQQVSQLVLINLPNSFDRFTN
jgi:hypothetical protein